MPDKQNIRSRQEIRIAFFLVILTLAVYLPVRNYDFVSFDDPQYVTDNPYVQMGLTAESISWAMDLMQEPYFHPLTWLSLMLDAELYGMEPGMFHSLNLLFHIAGSLLLFFLFRTMTGEVWKSAAVALLFALHPLNVESVAWIAERKNVLSTFFWILTLFIYQNYARYPNIYKYILILAVFVLGLLSKPMLITLPFVMLLLDYWPLNRLYSSGTRYASEIIRLILEKIPFIIISLVFVYLNTVSIRQKDIFISLKTVPLSLRISNALVSYAVYLKKMFFPFDLAFFYPFPSQVPFWQVAAASAVLIIITLICFGCLRKMPYLAVGWLWYLGTLIPVTGIRMAGVWPAYADRWTYVPLIGIFMAAVWGTEKYLPVNDRKRYCALILFLLVLFLVPVAGIQVSHWRDDYSLSRHALKVTENNFVAHEILGNYYKRNRDCEKAIPHFYEVLQYFPDKANIHNNMGICYASTGKPDKALYHFSHLVKIHPGNANFHNNMGLVLMQTGNPAKAAEHFAKALQISPNDSSIAENLKRAEENNPVRTTFDD